MKERLGSSVDVCECYPPRFHNLDIQNGMVFIFIVSSLRIGKTFRKFLTGFYVVTITGVAKFFRITSS